MAWNRPGSGGAAAAAALLAGAALLLLGGLGATDLWAPDEPRYAQVAEELRSLEHGARGLALLHLDGEPYTQKPPLYFWLAALAGAPGGRVDEWAARLPSALAGVASVGLTLWLGRALLGAASAWLGAGILLTAFEFAWRARRAHLDVLLCLLELLALTAFWRLDRGGGSRGRDLALLHGALGLAVLTKGPVGLLVPLLSIAAYLLWEGRPRDLARVVPLRALPLSLGPGLVWLALLLALGPAQTFDDAVVENLWGRFFAGTSHPRPLYYYLHAFPLDFLPWTLLWPAVAWAARRRVFAPGGEPAQARAWRLLLAWVGASFVFFSLSAGKRGLYLLPAYPAAALLCADAWLRAWGERPRLARAGAAAGAALALALPVAALVARRVAAERFGVDLPLALAGGLAGAGAAAVLLWRVLPRTRAARAALALAYVGAVELCAFTLLLPALDPEKSPRPVARSAAALADEGATIGVVGRRSLVGGLAYYGGHPVAVLDGPGEPARFVAAGGRVLVVTQRRLPEVREALDVEVRAAQRSGRRTLYVVTAAVAPPDADAPGGRARLDP